MKAVFKVFLRSIFLFISICARAQNTEVVSANPNLVSDTSKRSIKSREVAIFKGDSVKITYYSPGVRNRVIWGSLVPYDKVWVTGAHDATSLEIPKPILVGNKEIPAGKYAIFTIPGNKEWTLIINRNWQQHLTSAYDQKEDMLRIKIKPKKVKHLERLQYFIERVRDNKGRISVAWERLKVEFPFVLMN